MERMTGAELRAIREARDETGAEFGAWLAELVGGRRDYSRQDVSDWENGRREIPTLVELALCREDLKRLKSERKHRKTA